jgi:hypothetical protein
LYPVKLDCDNLEINCSDLNSCVLCYVEVFCFLLKLSLSVKADNSNKIVIKIKGSPRSTNTELNRWRSVWKDSERSVRHLQPLIVMLRSSHLLQMILCEYPLKSYQNGLMVRLGEFLWIHGKDTKSKDWCKWNSSIWWIVSKCLTWRNSKRYQSMVVNRNSRSRKIQSTQK